MHNFNFGIFSVLLECVYNLDILFPEKATTNELPEIILKPIL
ncbi:hypothetical protein [Lysinibacillus sphaericus]|nr:hypothetical protein [Lysinibacillus sphaericus]